MQSLYIPVLFCAVSSKEVCMLEVRSKEGSLSSRSCSSLDCGCNLEANIKTRGLGKYNIAKGATTSLGVPKSVSKGEKPLEKTETVHLISYVSGAELREG